MTGRSRRLLVGLASLLVVGCSSAGVPSATSPSPSLEPAVGGTFPPGLPRAALHQGVLYPAASPCGRSRPPDERVATDLPDAGCQREWSPVDPRVVPPNSLMLTADVPTSVVVGPGVTADQAVGFGVAYLRDQALTDFALQNDDPALLAAIGGLPEPTSVTAALADAGSVTVPACARAVDLQAALLTTAEAAAVGAQGYPNASATAIVASFSACPEGLTAGYANGNHQQLGGTEAPLPQRLVITGVIGAVGPVADVWTVDGVADCRLPALVAVCAG